MRFFAYVMTLSLLLQFSVAAQPAAWVTIKGQVILPPNAGIPRMKQLNVAGANAAACLKNGPIVDKAITVDPETRGIQNVVVWLRPGNPKAKAFAPNEIHPADAGRKSREHVIDQPCCEFTPRVLAVRAGDTLAVNNPAAFPHNFFWVSANNGEFNQNIEAKAQFKFPKPLVAEPAPILYKCTIHPWMTGMVRIFDHPYYAVTDEMGNFEIKNAPAGNYRLVYWHEKVGFLDGREGRFGIPVMVAPGKNGVMEIKATEFDVR